VKEGKPALDPD
jgi:hypothetical protein